MAKKITPHIVIIALFAVIALAFFYPVLQGKGIFQSDIAQYTGMAKERNDYQKTKKPIGRIVPLVVCLPINWGRSTLTTL